MKENKNSCKILCEFDDYNMEGKTELVGDRPRLMAALSIIVKNLNEQGMKKEFILSAVRNGLMTHDELKKETLKKIDILRELLKDMMED